ncbi:hypothetical protein DAI22_08g008050 [Oryza sativa Japonica Group]|nr:hypothetical protein DAI22_08g008050 [Oryza sativa Japonica Group]
MRPSNRFISTRSACSFLMHYYLAISVLCEGLLVLLLPSFYTFTRCSCFKWQAIIVCTQSAILLRECLFDFCSFIMHHGKSYFSIHFSSVPLGISPSPWALLLGSLILSIELGAYLHAN